MGKRRGREPERQRRPVSISSDVATPAGVEPKPQHPMLRPLEFSRQLEAGFGKEFLNEVKALAATLEEYEMLVHEQQLSSTDVLQYLDVVGFFDDLPQRLTEMNEMVMSHKMRKFEEMVEKRKQDPNRVHRLLRTNQVDFNRCIADRPFLSYFINDVFASSFLYMYDHTSLDPDEMIRIKEEQAHYPFAFEKFLFNQTLKHADLNDPNEEKGVAKLFNHFCLFSLARQHARHAAERNPEQLARDKQRADSYAAHLKHLPLEHTNGKLVPLPIEDTVPWIKSASFFLSRSAAESTMSLSSGIVQLCVRFDTEAKDIHLLLDVSRVTGDLCPNGFTVLSAQGAFERLDQGTFYDHIRRVLLEGLYTAIVDGTLKEKVEELNDAEIPVVHTSEETEYGATLPEAPPSPVEALVPQKEALPPKEKVRLPKTISYRRVVAALKRLGFEITSGGRHHKISWTTKRGVVSLPFLHDHEGSDRLVALAIPKILRMAGVSAQDFMTAY